jgi:purine-binding chemotaxis protein CheW
MVLLRTGQRRVALAVESVVGVRSLSEDSLSDLPPLLASADSGVVAAIGAHDRDLLLVLEAARIISDDLRQCLEVEGRAE